MIQHAAIDHVLCRVMHIHSLRLNSLLGDNKPVVRVSVGVMNSFLVSGALQGLSLASDIVQAFAASLFVEHNKCVQRPLLSKHQHNHHYHHLYPPLQPLHRLRLLNLHTW